MAEDKWETGRRLDVIGWTIDLDSMRVSIARRNFLKIVYGFFSLDESKQVQVRTLETLASWAARYKAVLRHARPLTSALYAEISGMHNRDAYKPLSALGCQAVMVWRVLLCMLHFEPTAFSRSMPSFVKKPAEYFIGYDASLEGIGVGIGRVGAQQKAGVGGAVFPFDLAHDASNQNTAEFIAVVVGLAQLAMRGVQGAAVKLQGDSKTSLKWGLTECFRGAKCLAASSVFILLCTRYDLSVTECEFVPGVNNEFYDKISRGTSPAELGVPPDVVMDLRGDAMTQELLQLCDPTVDLTQPGALLVLWKRILEWVSKVTN